MSAEQYPDVVMPECPAEKLLEGQKALVTGGASGIGRAVAIALGRAGADVVVNYLRGEEQAKEVAAEAIRHCGDATNQGDLTPTVKGIFNRLMAFKR